MKTLNNSIIVISILTFIIADFGIAFAQSANPTNVYRALRKQYRSLNSFQADFREIFEWALTKETVEQAGRIVVTSDDRFYINTPEQLLVSDGKVIYRYSRSRFQVIIEPITSANEKSLPRKMMLDFGDEFKAAEFTALPVDGKAGFRLDLTVSKPEDLMIQNAAIWATQKDNVVYRLRFTDLNGNTTTYQFSDIQFDKKVDDTLFKFDIPEDAEVFDLR